MKRLLLIAALCLIASPVQAGPLRRAGRVLGRARKVRPVRVLRSAKPVRRVVGKACSS